MPKPSMKSQMSPLPGRGESVPGYSEDEYYRCLMRIIILSPIVDALTIAGTLRRGVGGIYGRLAELYNIGALDLSAGDKIIHYPAGVNAVNADLRGVRWWKAASPQNAADLIPPYEIHTTAYIQGPNMIAVQREYFRLLRRRLHPRQVRRA